MSLNAPVPLAFCAVNGGAAPRWIMLISRWPTAAGRSDQGRVSFTVITNLLTFRIPLGSIMPMLPLAALISGQVDVINDVPGVQVPLLKSSGMQAIINPGGGWTPLVMNTNAAPYNDVRVRQAMKMLIDRKQAITVARQGYATIGNDLFAKSDPLYASNIPQQTATGEGQVAVESCRTARHPRSCSGPRPPSRTSSRWR